MINEAYSTLLKIGEQAVVYEAVFDPDVQADYGLHFVEPNGLHIYIDVIDKNPIALKLVHNSSVLIEYKPAISEKQKQLVNVHKLAIELMLLDAQRKELSQNSTKDQILNWHVDFCQRLISRETRVLFVTREGRPRITREMRKHIPCPFPESEEPL